MTTTNFISGGNQIGYTNLSYKSTAVSSPIGSSLTGVLPHNMGTNNPSSYEAFTGSGGTSNSINVIIGDTTQRHGMYEVTPDLRLVVPAQTVSGSYPATLTFTIN